jgi:hypothetical protein
MDKATKLETVHDRVHALETRFEVLRRDAEIEFLRARLQGDGSSQANDVLKIAYRQKCQQYDDDSAFLRKANVGSEFMGKDDIARVQEIASLRWTDVDGVSRTLLTDDEVMNLSIQRGTLNDNEREIVNSHITVTIKMLEALPFPKHLQNVPEFAGGHHEKMDGTGYPRGLRREELSVQARIMAIADIFEALTATDRPYKKAKKLSECLKIMGLMSEDDHIDPDIFEIFIKQQVYMDYAEEFLDPALVDEIDETLIPGLSISA